jgi:ParB family chromosome partitioning protein
VSNLLRLLSLHTDIRDLVEGRKIDMGHARALLALDEKHQRKAADQIIEKELSVRQTEHLVRRMLEDREATPVRKANKDPDVKNLEDSLSERLGTRVEIKMGTSGKGKLVIDFHSNDVLQGILEKIH